MQFLYNHLIPKQCQKKKNQSEHLLYVQRFSQKTEGSDFWWRARRGWFPSCLSGPGQSTTSTAGSGGKCGCADSAAPSCPWDTISAGLSFMLLMRSCWDEVSSSELLWQAFWCVSSYLSKNKTLWLGMNAVQDWNETCLRFCLNAFSFLSAGVSANTKKKPCCVSLLSFLKACPRDSIKRGLQRQWCWCYSRELRVP